MLSAESDDEAATPERAQEKADEAAERRETQVSAHKAHLLSAQKGGRVPNPILITAKGRSPCISSSSLLTLRTPVKPKESSSARRVSAARADC